VPVLPPSGVRGRESEIDRLSDQLQVGSLGWRHEQCRGKQQIIRRNAVLCDVGLELVGDVCGELDAAMLAIFGVVLDEEPPAARVELRDKLDRDTADGEHPHPGVQVNGSQLNQFGPPQPGLDEHSVMSRRCR
jgi:hypothetical protein